LPQTNPDAVVHGGELEFATALSQRMVGYLGRLVDDRPPRAADSIDERGAAT
jgi:hypothetical protein